MIFHNRRRRSAAKNNVSIKDLDCSSLRLCGDCRRQLKKLNSSQLFRCPPYCPRPHLIGNSQKNQLYQYMNENGHFSSGKSCLLRPHSIVTCLLKNTDDWYYGMDLSKLVGLVFIDLKRHSIQLIITSSAKSLSFTAYSNENSLGLNPTLPTGSSFVGLMVWIQKLGTSKLVSHKVHVSALFSPSVSRLDSAE